TALELWLYERSVEVAAHPDEALIELAHVAQLTRTVGVPTADRLGQLADGSGGDEREALLEQATIHLTSRSERYLKVPASAGFSHWTWRLPDRKGHRMMVAARRVSRYEPLLRWWLNLHTRFDLPEEVALRPQDGAPLPNGVSAVHVITDAVYDPTSDRTTI